MVERVHHIAFVVGDLDAAAAQFEETLGLECYTRETMSGDYYLEVAVYELDGLLLELITPTREEGWIYDHWREHGDGFFHMAFEVPDIDAAIEQFAGSVTKSSRVQ
ncbi:VOC family protein [Halovenus salina]|uniref:VOC family protein n=1 Tax=Halovenus salina TaxID=1510225 RepID=UPI002260AB23|nr:VOC family protein [Halovenus salina]